MRTSCSGPGSTSVVAACTLGLALLASGCAHVGSVTGGRARTLEPAFQEGISSWYGDAFHGRRTSNGEVFNMYDYTAAHRTLPFGSRLRVTFLATGRSVVVRINDRGPFVQGRILDLSMAAARKIGLKEKGVGRVRLDLLRRGP